MTLFTPKICVVGILLTAFICPDPRASAQAPYVMSYSGRLATSNGESLRGPIDIEIKFYRDASGGNPLPVSPVVKRNVALVDGTFQVDLSELGGAEYHLIFKENQSTYIEVIDLTNKFSYPRQKLTSVPFAFKVPVDQTSLIFNSDGRLSVGQIEIGKVIGLEAALSQRSENSKSITIDSVTGLNAALGAKLNTSAPAGGDVSGNWTNVSVNKIRGITVPSPLAADTFLKYTGSTLEWVSLNSQTGGDMLKTDNLAGLTSPSTARTNLGLGPLAVASQVSHAEIMDGTITNQDIGSSAGIDDTKLATIVTPGKVSGNAMTSGTIGGTTTFGGSGGINTNGEIAGTQNFAVKGTGLAPTLLKFHDADNSNYVALTAPTNINNSTHWTLPPADGTSGQFLRTNGNGELGWASAGNGNMLGSNNLSDLSNPATARTNLGLGSLSTASAVSGGANGSITDLTITNADIASNAAIATSKLSGALTDIAGHGLGNLASLSTIGSSEINTGTVMNAHINTSAAIATSKLSGALNLVNNHGLGTLAFLNDVNTSEIVDGAITDAKISQISTSGKVLGSAISGAINLSAPITTIGNMGVGTTSPSSTLHVIDSSTSPSAEIPSLKLSRMTNTTASGVGVGFELKNSAAILKQLAYVGTVAESLTQSFENGAAVFYTTKNSISGERMRITSMGNVGIGTSTPSAILDIASTQPTLTALKVQNSTGTYPVELQLYAGANYGKMTNSYGALRLSATSNIILSPNSTDRLFVTPSGNVGIGTANPLYTLEVNGSVAGAVAFVTLSDRRAKKDIADLQNSLEKVTAIRGVSYKMMNAEKFGSQTYFGVIAQELENVVPEVVETGPDGIKRVRYQDLIPIMIEAFKQDRDEQYEMISKLKDQIDVLQEKVKELEMKSGT